MRTKIKQASGAVLVLVAICLALMVGIIGLAVDLNIALSAATEQQQLANSLASGALAAYLESAAGGASINEQLDTAARRAEEIVNLEQNRPFYQDLLGNAALEPQLCLRWSAALCDRSFDSLKPSNPDAYAGTIIPGNWYQELPPPSYPCGCGTCACPGGKYPCFVPNDNQSCPNQGANAFQIELRQSSASSIRTVFLKLLGFQNMRTSAFSTAAVVPRRLAVLIDLSPSVTGETHLQDPTDLTISRLPAFKLDPSISCIGDLPSINPCSSSFGTGCGGIVHSDDFSSIEGQFGRMWQYATATARGSNPSVPTVHYWDDYKCYEVQDDGDEDGISGAAHYLVDTFQDPMAGYYGPEPLSTIFRSIYESLELMEETAQPGDGIILMGLDRTLLRNRVIPASESGSYRLAPISVGNADYDRIKAITHVDPNQAPATYADDLRLRISNHTMFPRVSPVSNSNRRSGIWTNLKYAMWEGLRALVNDSSAGYADLEMVVFSDFLANCTVSYWEDDPAHCGATDLLPNEGCCFDDYDRIIHGVVSYLVRDFFFPTRRVHFNPIFFGGLAGPHTVLLDDGKGNCLWDEEDIRRETGWPLHYTNGGGGANCPPSSPSAPCYWPNRHFESAVNTGGVWGVIRPCCPGTDGNCVSDNSVIDSLNQHCRDDGSGTKYSPVSGVTAYTDASGRLRCDPHGRTPLEQMRDYMRQIMGTNPIRLVGPSQKITD